ncbi:MAG TPA: hypothetical protein VGO43_10385 [Pyrinomonadaceae bacterium]|jgi:hypothetical protein|nr:hypothetical protein [Pyrinomonadaceae bacterium]
MKTILLTILLSLAAVIGVSAQNSNQVSLKLGEQRNVSSPRLAVKFVNVVEDSRCPMNAKCIWAGNAKVRVTLSSRGRRSRTFELNSTLEPRTIHFGDYTVTFESLTQKPAGMHRMRAYRPVLVLTVSTPGR